MLIGLIDMAVRFLAGINWNNMGSEARSGKTHLDGGFAHSVKSVTASFGRRAFVYKISEYRCSCQDREIDVVESLKPVR